MNLHPVRVVFVASVCACLFFAISSANPHAVASTELSQTVNAEQEYYELRIYKIFDYDKQVACEKYLKNALLLRQVLRIEGTHFGKNGV